MPQADGQGSGRTNRVQEAAQRLRPQDGAECNAGHILCHGLRRDSEDYNREPLQGDGVAQGRKAGNADHSCGAATGIPHGGQSIRCLRNELSTGLRRVALLGLKWSDINWNNAVITVRRQVARVNGEITEAPLKTKNSYRRVSISPQAIEVLKAQKAKTNSEYVFPVAVPEKRPQSLWAMC